MFDSAWALFEGVVVFGGYSELPVVNLGLGFIRALAVVAVSFAAVDLGLGAAFRGERSIVVYLAFFLPMATMRALLLKFAPGLDLGVVALIVTMVAAITPLLFYAVVKDTRLSFLFERMAWARLKPARPPTLASDRLSAGNALAIVGLRSRYRNDSKAVSDPHRRLASSTTRLTALPVSLRRICRNLSKRAT